MTSWFPRTRATIRRRVWQYLFARRVMERTSYGFGDACEQAIVTQNVYPDAWHLWHPEAAADMRIDLTCPAERLRK